MSTAPSDRSAARYIELDSLRGVAALVVVFSHVLGVLPSLDDYEPSNWFESALIYSPLHALWAGTEAVTLFFVLSGFVLSLPFHGARNGTYPEYLFRRICRIYLPYLAAIVFALAMRAALSGLEVEGLGGLAKKMWQGPFTAVDAATHLLMVVVIPNGEQADPVIWSLTHEMRLSIIFPVIMWVVLRYRWYVPITASLAVAAASVVAGAAVGAESNARTGSYLVMFVIGALLAKHRHRVTAWCRSIGTPAQVALTAASIGLFTYSFWVFPHESAIHGVSLDLAVVTVGAAGFIVLALGSSFHQRFLLTRPVRYLGRVSYSLYLVHAVIILAALRLLYDPLPLVVVLPLAVLASIAVAGIGYQWIERPAIALGRRYASPRDAQGSRVSNQKRAVHE